MPVCPKCGKEIDHLINFEKRWEEFQFRLSAEGEPVYEQTGETVPGDDPGEYECPECNNILFYDHLSAVAFLKGENNDRTDAGRDSQRTF